MRRFVKTFVCIFVLACVIPVMAQASEKKEAAINTLVDIGVMDENSVLAEEVTRAEFVDYLCGMLRYRETGALYASQKLYADVDIWHKSAGNIEYLANSGIIDGMQDNMFYPDDAITYGQAYKLLVRSAGYREDYVSIFGEYPQGYAAVAGKLGISKDISANVAAVVSGRDAAYMLYNLLEAPYMRFDSVNGGVLDFKQTDTFAEEVMELEPIRGQLLSDRHISLTGEPPSENIILIGEKSYTAGSRSYSDFLGMEVTGYAYTGGGENEIVTLTAANSASCIVLEDEEIEKYENGAYVYYPDKTASRPKRTVVPEDVAVIYNFVLSGRKDNMVPEDGTVRLIFNNNRVTSVIITAYQTYYVDEVDRENMLLRAGEEIIRLKGADLEYLTPQMRTTSFEEIKQGSVVSFARNQDVQNSYGICMISNKQVEANITGVSRDDYGRLVLQTQKEAYTVQAFAPIADSADYVKKSMKLYLDHEGKVFYAESSRNSDAPYYRYGYLIRVYYDEGTDGVIYKILDQDGKIYSYQSKKKMIVNEEALTKEAAYQHFLWDAAQNITARQAIRYHEKDGVISAIQTGQNYQEGTKVSDKLLIRANAKRYYYKPNNTFKRLLPVDAADRMTAEVIVANNPVVFMVPPETAMSRKFEDSEFKVINLSRVMSEDKACWIKAYNTDSQRLDEDLIVYFHESSTVFDKGNPYLMVTEVSTVYDEASESVVTQVTGLGNNTTYTYKTDDFELFKPNGYEVKRGDMIRVINSEADGMAEGMELVFTPDYDGSIMGKNQAYYPSGTMRNVGYRLIYGRIEQSNDGIISVIYGTETEQDREFFRAGSLPIYVYDSDMNGKESVYQGGAEDLKVGCRTLVVSFWAKPAYLFVYVRD